MPDSLLLRSAPGLIRPCAEEFGFGGVKFKRVTLAGGICMSGRAVLVFPRSGLALVHLPHTLHPIAHLFAPLLGPPSRCSLDLV